MYNAIDNSTNTRDSAGHGTHVTGIAAAAHLDGWGVGGVSNSSILSAKVLDSNGTGSASALARGLMWCADNGADVVLMALSLHGSSSAVQRAIDALAAKDVVMVASAGNGGCTGCVSYPARDPRVIAVAASDESGALASFSSTGPEVALRAPGISILSDLPGNAFGYGSGTSQSAGFVAGAAALLLEAVPTLRAADVRSALVSGANDHVLDVEASLRIVAPQLATNATDATEPTETTNATEPMETTNATGPMETTNATEATETTEPALNDASLETAANLSTSTNTTEGALLPSG